ncbi:sodium:proton antiporter [Aeromicrobium panaciterrae]|uniref:cation:proton antiporter n=1 Tax=Aeromicrobium panaciterrae TaxID=363861 RepID=UPI0031D3B584
MDLTLLAIVGVLVVVAVSGLSPRLGIAAPLLLVAAGVALSYAPGVPTFEVEPEIILAGVLPPLLYASAVNMPMLDFRRDLKSIGGLSVVVVAGSAVLLGLIFDRIIPDIGLAEGIALGAVLSPTDAVATSIVKRTGVAPRLVTVLEGESMLNDASALVLLRSAIAATGVTVSLGGVAWDFVVAVVGAVAIGWVIGLVSVVVRSRLSDATLNTALSFVVPFAAYAPAEHFGVSGLVAVVTTGLITGYLGPEVLPAQARGAETVNWKTIAFLLEGGVFLLVGLEAPGLVEDFQDGDGEWGTLALATVIAVAVLLAVRVVYVVMLIFGLRQDIEQTERRLPRVDRIAETLGTPRGQQMPERRRKRIEMMVERSRADLAFYKKERLGFRDGAVLTWAGMRGVVTLAAAQTLPSDTPQRPLLILIAFSVAVATLVIQGGTLSWVVRSLGVEADREGQRREELLALGEILNDVASSRCDDAETEGLDGALVDPLVLTETRKQSRPDKFTAWAGTDDETRSERLREYRRLRLAILADQRGALLEARSTGRFDSTVLAAVLSRVDAAEMSLNQIE